MTAMKATAAAAAATTDAAPRQVPQPAGQPSYNTPALAVTIHPQRSSQQDPATPQFATAVAKYSALHQHQQRSSQERSRHTATRDGGGKILRLAPASSPATRGPAKLKYSGFGCRHQHQVPLAAKPPRASQAKILLLRLSSPSLHRASQLSTFVVWEYVSEHRSRVGGRPSGRPRNPLLPHVRPHTTRDAACPPRGLSCLNERGWK